MPIYPLSAPPLKMRAMLVKRYIAHDDPTSDYLPALTTARTKYKARDPQALHEFLPESRVAIPKCD